MLLEAKLEDTGANHPRKIFRRERWSSLNGVWDFTFDDKLEYQTPEDVKQWAQKITVPFAPETKASGINDTDFHPRCWYRKTFNFKPNHKRMILHFGAVDYQAKVWFNGEYLGEHEGGHTPFSFDITDSLNPEGEQIIILRADDDPHDLAKPRGKQDWQREPHSIWYPRTSGIWQTVWIEEVNTTYIEKINCSPLLERWEIGCEAFVAGPCPPGLVLRVKLTKGEQLLADDSYNVINKEVHRRIALSDSGIDDFRNELLWSPEKPTLLTLDFELWLGTELIDKVHSYTALRSVSYNRDRFILNGRPYYLRLLLDQGYWPDTFMTPPSAEALIKDIKLVKEAGFNGVRKHQKVEDPDFFYWADVMGLVVWAEMPSAYRFTNDSVKRITKEWLEVMERDINHPSIIVWVPFNESWGVPDLASKLAHQNCVKALYHLTKTLDPTRPCIGNDGWESTATDILGIHDYDEMPERILKKYCSVSQDISEILHNHRPGGRVLVAEGHSHEGQPVMLTEFGGIAFVEPSESVQKTWGYSSATSSAEFRKRYEALMNVIHRIDLFTGFCYTQFTDTFQEANGLFTADRRPKIPLAPMARATRGIGLGRGELPSVPQPPPIPHDNDPLTTGMN